MGQGAPEVDDSIEGCFERPREVDISAHGREYGPTAGIRPLREAVAKLYNEHHRKWRKSQYTWENVCIVPGGRAGLIRIAAVLGNCYLGFFIPGAFACGRRTRLGADRCRLHGLQRDVVSLPKHRCHPRPTRRGRPVPHVARQDRRGNCPRYLCHSHIKSS